MTKLLALVLLVCGTGLAQKLTFIEIGDWGTDSQDQDNVAAAMSDYVTDTDPSVQFILSTGDNFYPDGVNAVDDLRWTSHWELRYNLPGIEDLDWYISIGNHDTGSDGREWNQVAYSAVEPRWKFPNITWSFYKDVDANTKVHFIAVCTDSIKNNRNDVPSQLAYLEQELANSDGDYIIVFGHHPPYNAGRRCCEPAIESTVVPLMEQYGVDIFLAGHDHNMQHTHKAENTDIDYVTNGGGGRGLYSYSSSNHAQIVAKGFELLNFERSHGYTVFEIDNAGIEFTFYNELNVDLYNYRRPRSTKNKAKFNKNK